MSTLKAAFTPPFCPNPDCSKHRSPGGWTFKRRGFFRREAHPHRVQRFRCNECHRHFSTQTFQTTYWLRRPDLQEPIFNRIIRCSSLRQIASELEVAPSTVMRHVERLGRHCMLFHLAHLRGHLSGRPPTEALALDGFETFEWSQYFPFHLNLLVGTDSHYTYGFTDSELRRKGRMTAWQGRRRAQLEQRLGRPDPRAIDKACTALLAEVLPEGSSVVLHTDDHRAYPRALDALVHRSVQHVITSSKERRTTRNPLFPVNLMDLLIRHGSANHKRETIAWSKRRQAAVERLWILLVWRNYQKAFSEKKGKRDRTPAQRLGVLQRRLTTQDVLARRLQPSRLPLSEVQEGYYRREVRTRALPQQRRHELKYAF